MNKDILICGVGGQGTVLASKLTASAAMREGNIVHSAETIGMAQRGGSVTSHVRIGDKAFSPLIGGSVIVNSHPVKPITESLNDTGYDGTKMIEFLKSHKVKTCVVDADEICKPFGSSKFFNIIILGVATGAGLLGISKDSMILEIEQKVKAKFVDINKKAFAAGIKVGEEYAAQ